MTSSSDTTPAPPAAAFCGESLGETRLVLADLTLGCGINAVE
jgi:hypothetical protein